jgi:hypothetical protein
MDLSTSYGTDKVSVERYIGSDPMEWYLNRCPLNVEKEHVWAFAHMPSSG